MQSGLVSCNTWLAKWVYEQLDKERRSLENSHTKRIPNIPFPQIRRQVQSLATNVITLDELSPDKRRQVMELTKLASHFGIDFMNQVASTFRKSHTPGRHHAHRGWKPSHKRAPKHEHRRFD